MCVCQCVIVCNRVRFFFRTKKNGIKYASQLCTMRLHHFSIIACILFAETYDERAHTMRVYVAALMTFTRLFTSVRWNGTHDSWSNNHILTDSKQWPQFGKRKDRNVVSIRIILLR